MSLASSTRRFSGLRTPWPSSANTSVSYGTPALERGLHHAHILRRHVGVVGALHDEEAARDALDGVDGRALAVALGRHGRAAAHHLLAVGADVGPRRLVVDDEVGHAADRRRRGDEL